MSTFTSTRATILVNGLPTKWIGRLDSCFGRSMTMSESSSSRRATSFRLARFPFEPGCGRPTPVPIVSYDEICSQLSATAFGMLTPCRLHRGWHARLGEEPAPYDANPSLHHRRLPRRLDEAGPPPTPNTILAHFVLLAALLMQTSDSALRIGAREAAKSDEQRLGRRCRMSGLDG